MSVIKMTDLDLKGKRVFIRADLNVPVKDGKVTSDARIRATIPTLKLALEKGAKVMVTSHLGRPTEGEFKPEDSLQPVVDYLKDAGFNVRLVQDYLNGVDVKEGEIVVLENVRVNKGEKKNDPELGKKYAALCDVFVMDAFGTAHRAQASTYGVAEFAPVACAGPLLAAELDALGKALKEPARPMVAIVGGSKVSTKITIIENILPVVDNLIIGGGMAFTFIKAQGGNVGNSLVEDDKLDLALEILEKAKNQNVKVYIPVDVIAAKEFNNDAERKEVAANEIPDGWIGLDVGSKSQKINNDVIMSSKTILWNGPLGVFEMSNFAEGTKALGDSIAEATKAGAFSLVGGGDSVAFVKQFGYADKVSYVSTGGGAMLESLEGLELPGISAINK